MYTSFVWWPKSVRNEVTHNSLRDFLPSAHQGALALQSNSWGNGVRNMCLDMFFLGSPLSLHAGEGPVTVTSWPWPKPVCSGMYHPAAHLEENKLTHIYAHVTNHSQGVTLAQHSVSIKQVGRKDKRACFGYNMRVHTEQIPIYSLYLFEPKLTEYACCFAETLGAA